MIFSDNAKRLEMILDKIDKSTAQQLLNTTFLQTTKTRVPDYSTYQAFPLEQIMLALTLAIQHIGRLTKAQVDLPRILKQSMCELQDAIKRFCETDLCKQYFQDLVSKTLLVDQIEFVNERLKLIVRRNFECSDIELSSTTEGITELLKIYLVLEQLLDELDDALYTISIDDWKKALFDPGCREKSDARRFVVHFFNSSCKALQSYHLISCSLISKKCNVSYNDLGYGFLYNQLQSYLVGMSPSDISYVSETYEYKEDQVANLLALLSNELRLPEQFIKLQHCGNDVLTMYPLDEFESRTPSGRHNEILLRGNAVPSAVFVFKDRFEELKDRVLVWSSAMNLPVVIYDKDADEVQYIDKLRVKCDTDIT